MSLEFVLLLVMLKMKLDIVMWTKNGSKTLFSVLNRINKVIPGAYVNQKLIIDDSSTDNTKQICKKANWKVLNNPGNGISDAANFALEQIQTEYFCSFEQDLLLNYSWWNVVSKHIGEKNVVAVSGLQVANYPNSLKNLQEYNCRKYQETNERNLKKIQTGNFTFGKTLDNTLWNTKLLRDIGGFPHLKNNVGVDTVLLWIVEKKGLKWIVKYNLKNDHIRFGLRQEFRHQYWYGANLKEVWSALKNEGISPNKGKIGVFARFLYSPIAGLLSAIELNDPNLIWLRPMMQGYFTAGLLFNI